MIMRLAAAALFLLAGLTGAFAQSFETAAKQAIVMDYETGSVLFQKNADELMPPASMAKLMTMEVVFDAVKRGALELDDTFTISKDVWQRGGATSGGSTMFADLNDDIALENLIRGVIVQSGNDAAMAIAEGMAGSETGFAGLMNQRARRIGLEKSNFTNSTGLPDPNQRVTARELGLLARHLIRTYPELYQIYAEPEFTWNKVRQRNRNPILGRVDGADGLKTGYTEASGYGLTASAKVGDKRIIIVLNGMSSQAERRNEAIKMMRWAFRAFQSIKLFEEGEIVGEATLFGGAKSGVPLKAEGALSIFVPVGFRDRLKADIVFQGPIKAPVEAGTRIGKLQVSVDGEVTQETPLYAAEDVGTGTITQRAVDAVQELLIGLVRFD
ncbi:D-alanyl-D-alanine carboxypeptidase family protein [Ahrensia sp. R2A130]|uniref:D-alanyl-D-alanine carboxypeptidase family protein n=1 Tax=Ahrensia sp. R2A130 TaxID=744979 RepID=UPI0001E0C9AC|nr:D-alanyl-D-alanine carboxypeptidase family protein [Ahrensia sp. R2A130]EFL90261.1 D-alanyl-D-alanine carboxypeptidase DacC [Ahrensia sp. R2A130]